MKRRCREEQGRSLVYTMIQVVTVTVSLYKHIVKQRPPPFSPKIRISPSNHGYFKR